METHGLVLWCAMVKKLFVAFPVTLTQTQMGVYENVDEQSLDFGVPNFQTTACTKTTLVH